MAQLHRSIPVRTRRIHQRGMTLVEVLVALVIFALGMMGAGGLILSSMRSSQYSSNASVAISLARDYGEIMQLIPASVQATSEAGTGNTFAIDSSVAMTVPTQTCKTNACNGDQMIAWNVWEWAQRVSKELPGGRAVVCKDTDPKDANGLFRWTCDGAGTMTVIKFGWSAKTGAAGTGDNILNATDANNVVRPKLVVTLFGNQDEINGLGGTP
ncbi:MAG: type IV pilus modification protein PilV [Burkholderiaceae bacterium]